MKSHSPIFKTAKGEARYLAAYDEALDRWPKPFDSLDIPGRFGCTHINAAGPKDAPPLFLLCGAGVTSTMWAPNIAALSRARRVYAPDTISDLGRDVLSKMPASGAELAEWLRGIFDELHIDQADVAGLSHGGWIALNLALTAPERIRRMVLMDPAASFLPLNSQWHIRAMAAVFFPGQALTYSFARWNLSPRSPLGQSRMRDEPVFRQWAIGFRAWKPGGVPPTVFSDEELRSIETPTLLMMGEDEVIYDWRRAVERAKELIPNLEVEIVPRAGHNINMEQPDIVNERVLRFLA